MQITRSPMASDLDTEISVAGDTLTVHGIRYDFSDISEGD